VGYREDVRKISKLLADDERENPRGDSLGAQASPERGYVEADVPEAAGLPPIRLAQDRLSVAYLCRAARQAAAGRTRRHYDRSFGGSKRRLSLKSSADIVVIAPRPAYADRRETAFPASRMKTSKRPYGGLGAPTFACVTRVCRARRVTT